MGRADRILETKMARYGTFDEFEENYPGEIGSSFDY